MHKMHHRCEDFDVPFIINQNRYSILDRTVEKNDLKKEAKSKKKGLIAFSPLAQGQLTDKCANGIPENSRLYENRVLWEKVGYNEARQLQITQLYNIAKSVSKHFHSLLFSGFCNTVRLQVCLSVFIQRHSLLKI